MYDGAAVIWDITNRIQSKSTAPDELDAKVRSNSSEEQGLLAVTEFVMYLI